MKTIFRNLLVIILFTTVSSAQNIGIVRNAQYRITADLTPIKQQWEKTLNGQGGAGAVFLTDFTIQSGLDKASGKTYYMLLATNKDKSIKIGRALQLKAGVLSFITKDNAAMEAVVSCSGCSTGCIPLISDGKWICDPDCPAGKSPCTKSETTEK